MLDPVAPDTLFPVFDHIHDALHEHGILERFRGVGDSMLIAMDGTWYHSSQKVHCEHCSTLEHKTGAITYYHSAVTPALVAPGQSEVIALRPEFIVPQDGHTKQDCEVAAAKRWMEANAARQRALGAVTLLGYDLYAHQPMCRRALLHDLHFLFVCKPESHQTLYDWIALLEPGPDLGTLTTRIRSHGPRGPWHTYSYRWANGVPLADGDDALKVNWCEVSVTNKEGKILYRNAWISDWLVNEDNVVSMVASGRSRWKIENENNTGSWAGL